LEMISVTWQFWSSNIVTNHGGSSYIVIRYLQGYFFES
jgi:hypothetical protein